MSPDFYMQKRRAVIARNKYMETSYAGIRYGGLWAGPLQYKLKAHTGWASSIRARRLDKNIRGGANYVQVRLAEHEYKNRFVVISKGYLRLYKNWNHEDIHHAAEGYDELVTCMGLVKWPGACTTVNIQRATYQTSDFPYQILLNEVRIYSSLIYFF